MSPDIELRIAAAKERKEWESESKPFLGAMNVHLALAVLLDHIANAMEADRVVVQSHLGDLGREYMEVHPRNRFGDILRPRFDYTAALKVARAINGGEE